MNKSLPSDVIEFVGAKSSDTTDILTELSKLSNLDEHDRVVRCVVYLSRGSIAETIIWTQLALLDYRDVILNAEYDGHFIQLRDFGKSRLSEV